jgi:hypothetical protein
VALLKPVCARNLAREVRPVFDRCSMIINPRSSARIVFVLYVKCLSVHQVNW